MRPNLHLIASVEEELDATLPREQPPYSRYWDDDLPPVRAAAGRRRRLARAAGWVVRLVGAGFIMAAGTFLYLRNEPPSPPKAADAATPPAQTLAPARSGASVNVPPIASGALLPALPSADILVMLIRNSLLALQQANAAGNYAVLRALAAPEAQRASTPARFSQAFAPLREAHADLSAIAVTNPILSVPPEIGADGVLRLTGFFPTRQGQVDFALAYLRSGGRWYPVGLTVNPPAGETPASEATASSAKKVPDDATLITLIRNSVLSLDQANTAGDYSVLRENGAAGFRDANSLDKLAATFAALRGRQLDLSPVAVIAPRLFKNAAIDGDGYLRLTGYFPSHPEQVNFDLAYKHEDGAWRLFGIGLNTSVEVSQNNSQSTVVIPRP